MISRTRIATQNLNPPSDLSHQALSKEYHDANLSFSYENWFKRSTDSFYHSLTPVNRLGIKNGHLGAPGHFLKGLGIFHMAWAIETLVMMTWVTAWSVSRPPGHFLKGLGIFLISKCPGGLKTAQAVWKLRLGINN